MPDDPTLGSGRIANAPNKDFTLGQLLAAAKALLGLAAVRVVGDSEQTVTRVGLACGSGGSMLRDAASAGCDAFVTGEASFHDCLAAEARGVGLVLLGHYASERFAVEALAEQLATELPDIHVWASEREHDPIRTA